MRLRVLARPFRPLYRFLLNRSLWFAAYMIEPPTVRHMARHKLLTNLSKKWGFPPPYEMHVTWARDPETIDVWKGFPESTDQILERHANLYYLAKSAQNIPGDTAECGVFRGAGSWFILNAIKGKEHHIFDSFYGLSAPTTEDNVTAEEAFKWKSGDLAIPEEVVAANLSRFRNYKLHKGWIPERFEEVSARQFSFVHIDVDLFQPTFDSLQFFYDRVSPGGLIICDDYGFTTCPGAKQAMDEFFANKPESIVKLTTSQAFVIKT